MDDARGSTLVRSFLASLPRASLVPGVFVVFYLFGAIAPSTLKLSVATFYCSFFALPLIYRNVYFFQKNVVFLNFANAPANTNYADPATAHGLEGARNFYLKTEGGVTLGVWHVPFVGGDESKGHAPLDDGRDVIVYSHGNAGNRASPHRVELYRVLRRRFHVIAYDYRGYGDSSNEEPTERGLADDCTRVYEWTRARAGADADVYVWGHSLGSGVSTRAVARFRQRPAGLVLESPFNNMRDVIVEHPYARPFRCLPWFFYSVIEPMQANGLQFRSDRHVRDVDCPIAILHAEDDGVVPYPLGAKLYRDALEARRSAFFYRFRAGHGYGHNFICRAPELDGIIGDFVAHCKEEKRRRGAVANTDENRV